jgi:hypothetical protein
MAYRPLPWQRVPKGQTPRLDRAHHVLHHTDMMLSDVYEAFHLPIHNGGGAGVFSIALVLLCLVDALSKHVDQEATQHDDRFCWFVHNRLRWPTGGNAIPVHDAHTYLHREARDMLVHVAGVDDRRSAHVEPGRPKDIVIGKWGLIPTRYHDIELIDARKSLPDDWPILYVEQNRDGGDRRKLALAPLYWSIKQAARELIREHSEIGRKTKRKRA